MPLWSLSLELDRPNIKILGFSRGVSDPSANTLYPQINRVFVRYLNKRSQLSILQEVFLEVKVWVLLRSRNYHFSSSRDGYIGAQCGDPKFWNWDKNNTEVTHTNWRQDGYCCSTQTTQSFEYWWHKCGWRHHLHRQTDHDSPHQQWTWRIS